MKRCILCNRTYVSTLKNCSSCGAGATLINGFDAYAPDFAHDGGGFKSSYFEVLAELEEANFWFRSRNRLILWALGEYCHGFRSLLEIGCGTGYVLSGIAQEFPHTTLTGSEIFTAGLRFVSSRTPLVGLMQMDARNIPFSEEFDVVGAFDVLEHIKEDEHVLTQVRTALKPKGFMFLTVPQHYWLWSANDEYACHFRRYSAAELHSKIKQAGFEIVRTTSFVTILLPAMMISRYFQRGKSIEKFDATAELKIPSKLNSLFLQLLRSELALIRKGVNFPVGGSRLVVAKKI